MLVPRTNNKTPDNEFPEIQDAFKTHPELLDLCGKLKRVLPQEGLTNRVFRLDAEKGAFFLRLPRLETAGTVDREAEAANLSLAAELCLALPALFCKPDAGVLVTGAVDVVDDVPPDLPQKLGASLGRLHASGAQFEGQLDPDAVYRAQRDELRSVSDFRAEMAPLDEALQDLSTTMRLKTEDVQLVPSHGDLSPGNCLSTADRLWLIDWEYSGMSDPAWDIAYAVQEHGFSQDEESRFLKAYCGTDAADPLPDTKRLQLMKARCDAVSALWALEQVAKGRDPEIFLSFALARRDRALETIGRAN
jgi:aminoglycoside phosphotransferase (APT) family kinase protein